MKKKITAILLAMAMIISVGTIAMASTQSDGGIHFEEGKPGGVIDPECCECFDKDPIDGCDCECHKGNDDCCVCHGEDPEDNCDCDCHEKDTIKRQLASMDIDFGSQQISLVRRTYDSLTQARFGNNTGTVDNDSKLRAAGFLVESPTVWRLNLTISNFVNEADKQAVLNGFTLKLNPGLFADKVGNTTFEQGRGPWIGTTTGISSNPDVKPTLSAPTLSAGVPVEVATGGIGYSGGNFAGELLVPGGSARAGEAKASLTWDYIAGGGP